MFTLWKVTASTEWKRRNHSVSVGDKTSILLTGESEPEPVLDLGCVATGEETQAWTVQRIRLSPQEKHLAATLKTWSAETTRCVVVKLGRRRGLTLDNVVSFEWATDDVLFYTTREGLKCRNVYRLDLTQNGSTIRSVYEESQPDIFVEVSRSRDGHVLSITCSGRSSSEALLVDVSDPRLEPVLVQVRQPQLLYYVEHWRRNVIILANTGPGREYQVAKAPISEPSMMSWDAIFTPRPGTALKDMDVVGDHCVLVAATTSNELELIVVPLSRPRAAYTLQLPSWACAVESQHPGFAEPRGTMEFLISSPVRPPVSYRLRLEEGLLSPGAGGRPAPSPTNRAREAITARLKARSQDGTSVPVTLLHGGPCTKDTPLLVHVYGAYGRDVDMRFRPEKRFLLEQGWALAYCHIRGGGERGLAWQRQARVEGKRRSVEDLQACLAHLFASGVSSPRRTVLTARSAGAVPVGALCNGRPDMMRAVTLQSPFLDVLATMEDPKLPLTLEDREEWGDPLGNPQHRLTIASYCPVCNITSQRYPSMLLTAYADDQRTPLAGVLKYAEKLKEAAKADPEPNIVVNVQPGANHGGPDDWEAVLEEEALQLAFLYKELDVDPPGARRRRTK
ncbi:prolyl endopeptidase-like isoform X2 [Hippocampus comes]|uniref:prolyl endopeptidase-like isoform X2 n=1 Tax=Hippocampus comes TaxID=109280 RepID=UPI00094EC1BE|nr:PREDICTED: prolyl endopeptidase-like isoform X2 [Hippocampus comes]